MIHFLHKRRLAEFFRLEEAGGLVLMVATVIALAVANSPLAEYYNFVLKEKHLGHWINDGLMAIFFFVVGLEIKREIKEGELSNWKDASVPLLAAICGIAVPAGIFYLINMDHAQNLRGWAIPTATDIAFSLGILALIGSRAPLSLKILLTAIAIIDDLAAILIIAVFYTAEINFMMIGGAAICIIAMSIFNLCSVKGLLPYLVLGVVTWVALLHSGVHPTMAGVITAFCVPIYRKGLDTDSWIDKLIHRLHPYTAFFILPVFAFANAGVSLSDITAESFSSPILLGVVGGLVLGKTIGITLALSIMKPKGVGFIDRLGLGLLCGVGFTMSLFIGELAFRGGEAMTDVKLGVLVASAISGSLAFLLLRFRKA